VPAGGLVNHVFTRDDGTIHPRWSSELVTAPRTDGQHPRHVDYMWPIWKVLDLIPRTGYGLGSALRVRLLIGEGAGARAG